MRPCEIVCIWPLRLNVFFRKSESRDASGKTTKAKGIAKSIGHLTAVVSSAMQAVQRNVGLLKPKAHGIGAMDLLPHSGQVPLAKLVSEDLCMRPNA